MNRRIFSAAFVPVEWNSLWCSLGRHPQYVQPQHYSLQLTQVLSFQLYSQSSFWKLHLLNDRKLLNLANKRYVLNSPHKHRRKPLLATAGWFKVTNTTLSPVTNTKNSSHHQGRQQRNSTCGTAFNQYELGIHNIFHAWIFITWEPPVLVLALKAYHNCSLEKWFAAESF